MGKDWAPLTLKVLLFLTGDLGEVIADGSLVFPDAAIMMKDDGSWLMAAGARAAWQMQSFTDQSQSGGDIVGQPIWKCIST